MRSRRIVVAPLDWGLGHATRCVPLIRILLSLGHEVVLAGTGASLRLLKQEFPQLPCHHLPGYSVRYSGRAPLVASLLLQAPRLLYTVRKEHRALESIVDRVRPDALISDNRYGLWSRRIPAVLITHQLHLPAPGYLRSLVQPVNRRFISRFSECWVPDAEVAPGLAGSLSHPPLSGIVTHYIGPLSRFGKSMPRDRYEYDLAVLLSGPEPQRSILERIVRQQAAGLQLRTVVVQGKPGQDESEESSLHTLPHLPADELSSLLQSARRVVSRSGYSSIMDYHALGKDAILVPTPGQAEQEYLADRFREEKIFYSAPQSDFSLEKALRECSDYNIPPAGEGSRLMEFLENWTERISSC